MASPVEVVSSSPLIVSEKVFNASAGGNSLAGAFVGSFVVGQSIGVLEAQYPNNLDASAVLAFGLELGHVPTYERNEFRAQFTPDGRVFWGVKGQFMPTQILGQNLTAGVGVRTRIVCALDGTVTHEKTVNDGVNWSVIWTFAEKATLGAVLHARFYVPQNRKTYQLRQSGLVATVEAPAPPAPTPPAPTPPPPSPVDVSTKYNGLYEPSWTPDSSRTYKGFVSQAMPPKSGPSGGYTDPNFGVRIHRVAQVSDIDDNVNFLRPDYSRRSPWNADGSKYVLLSEKGWWHLFDAETDLPIDGGRTQSPGNKALNGPAGTCEFTWHNSDPNKAWHTGNYGTMVWYLHDLQTKSSSVIFDLTQKVKDLGGAWTNAARTTTKGEGMPSLDGRFWTLVVKTLNHVEIGVIRYDRVEDRITGHFLIGNSPDHVSTSPLTGLSVVSWYNTTDGVRVYSPDFSSNTKISHIGQHSDLFIDHLGRECFAWISFHGSAEGVTDGAVSWCLLHDHSQRWSTAIRVYPEEAGVGRGVHISGCAWGRPGYVVVSIYSGTGQNPHSGRVMVVQMKPGGEVYRIADHRSNTGLYPTQDEYSLAYASEPQAVPNRDLTRIMWASNMGVKSNGIQTMQAVLPAWAFPVL